ncbi:hypothetical protein CC86DRAFT_374324 [Ophiobolus disseminans]|uniref:DUF1711-domain-containing protein n=1 Tax=Ophiobolus disseminans TaxID=1469910 RepID=A0A6A6ZHQ0_9PLEO|nr:hypothetical protein CC86DRAFT_374324 [Ophiobolus disseminans]
MSTKPAKSKTVILRLSPKALGAFPHTAAATPPQSKPASSPDTPAPQIVEPPNDTPTDTDAAAAMNGTSTPSSLAPPAAGPKRKGPAPKKRSIAAVDGASSAAKARAKPGPKTKKQKLGDMINDPNSTTPVAMPAPAQKLGPKANAGAINANLRSLDRTGKFKARKWQKTGFRIRTFTGSVVELPSWKAPQRSAAFSEDVKSDSTGSSDSKIKDESSAVSDKSGLTPVPPALDAMASSPAPVAAGS